LSIAIGAVLFALAHGPLLAGAALGPALFVTYELAVPEDDFDAPWARVRWAEARFVEG